MTKTLMMMIMMLWWRVDDDGNDAYDEQDDDSDDDNDDGDGDDDDDRGGVAKVLAKNPTERGRQDLLSRANVDLWSAMLFSHVGSELTRNCQFYQTNDRGQVRSWCILNALALCTVTVDAARPIGRATEAAAAAILGRMFGGGSRSWAVLVMRYIIANL